jgi:hypothetical protein
VFGRVVFGASAVLFGVIALMWHDADTWQSLGEFWKLPSGTFIGEAIMVALLVGGVGLLLPQTARPASIVLIFVYSLCSLACVPGIIAHPKIYAEYGSFFEQFSLLCGAFAVLAAIGGNKALGRIARVGLGLCAISFTLAQVFYLQFTASLVPTWIPPSQMFWTILTTIAFGLAAIAILINAQARLAMRLMTLMLALFGLLVWVPQVIAHPEAHGNWSEFALNFLITGAAWMVAELKAL